MGNPDCFGPVTGSAVKHVIISPPVPTNYEYASPLFCRLSTHSSALIVCDLA